jgi:hypothetical protein
MSSTGEADTSSSSSSGQNTSYCWPRTLLDGSIQYCYGLGKCDYQQCNCFRSVFTWEADGLQSFSADNTTRQCRYNLRQVTGAWFTAIQVCFSTPPTHLWSPPYNNSYHRYGGMLLTVTFQIYIIVFLLILLLSGAYGLVVLHKNSKLKYPVPLPLLHHSMCCMIWISMMVIMVHRWNLQTLAIVSILCYATLCTICWCLDPLYALDSIDPLVSSSSESPL